MVICEMVSGEMMIFGDVLVSTYIGQFQDWLDGCITNMGEGHLSILYKQVVPYDVRDDPNEPEIDENTVEQMRCLYERNEAVRPPNEPNVCRWIRTKFGF